MNESCHVCNTALLRTMCWQDRFGSVTVMPYHPSYCCYLLVTDSLWLAPQAELLRSVAARLSASPHRPDVRPAVAIPQAAIPNLANRPGQAAGDRRQPNAQRTLPPAAVLRYWHAGVGLPGAVTQLEAAGLRRRQWRRAAADAAVSPVCSASHRGWRTRSNAAAGSHF